jgi:lysophospholipase L1-like esterase
VRILLVLITLLLSACGGGSPATAPLGQEVASQPSLLIIGDSHAALWGQYGARYTWLFRGWKVRYAGIGGQTSEQIEARLGDELAKGCTVVVVIAGTNDVLTVKGAKPDAVARMAQRVQQAGCSPILFRIPRITYPTPPSGTSDVTAWNSGVAVISEPMLDGYAVSEQPSTMRDDGVHFNDVGYGQLSAALHSLVGG